MGICSILRSTPWRQPVSGSWSSLSHPIKKLQSFPGTIFQSLFPTLFPPASPSTHTLVEPLCWTHPAGSQKGSSARPGSGRKMLEQLGKPSYSHLGYQRVSSLLSLSPARIAKSGRWGGGVQHPGQDRRNPGVV